MADVKHYRSRDYRTQRGSQKSDQRCSPNGKPLDKGGVDVLDVLFDFLDFPDDVQVVFLKMQDVVGVLYRHLIQTAYLIEYLFEVGFVFPD